MNFVMLKTIQPQRLNKLEKSKFNFFTKKSDLNVFHTNKFNNDLHHVVFNVEDEYQITAKKLGIQHTINYTSLINLFYDDLKAFLMMEYINEDFTKSLLKDLNNKLNLNLELFELNNDIFLSILTNGNKIIKHIDYQSYEGEYLSKDYIKFNEFMKLQENSIVDSVTFIVDDRMVTAKRNGKISIDNDDELHLINQVREIIDAI